MTAGVAGGVAGAVDAKLTVFICDCSFSSVRGNSGGAAETGGRGNRESENGHSVGCCPLEVECSQDGLNAVPRGERGGRLGVTQEREDWPMDEGECPGESNGFGSLLIGLNLRTFPVSL